MEKLNFHYSLLKVEKISGRSGKKQIGGKINKWKIRLLDRRKVEKLKVISGKIKKLISGKNRAGEKNKCLSGKNK